MRKLLVYLLGFAVLCSVILLVGCEGEQGTVGPPGLPGLPGPPGVDGSSQAPDGRHFAIGLTNRDEHAATVSGKIFLSFDSTVQSNVDTIVANYLETPPLIDGKDGEEPEWKALSQRINLDFLNPFFDDSVALLDPNIYEAYCRAGYDEENVYFYFEWKEIKIEKKTPDGDSTLLPDIESNELYELKLDLPNPGVDVETLDGGEIVFDTYFTYDRRDIDTIGTKFLIDTIIIPPAVTLYIPREIVVVDTNDYFVWINTGKGEDRFALMFGDEEVSNWHDFAFAAVFPAGSTPVAVPANINVDVWQWGASRSNPAEVADDWVLDGSGIRPDPGHGPYLDNWQLPDSFPLFMNMRDPNIRTSHPAEHNQIYPLWYYDAVSYLPQPGGTGGARWVSNRAAFLPGIVTTLPTDDRADIYAKASHDKGTWILEIKRARKTRSHNDVQF